MSLIKDIERFRDKLNETSEWPMRYMFKFVVPNNDGKVDLVKALFPQNGEMSFKHTKNLKFVSITCVAEMKNADQIIDITIQATLIEGVIAL